MNLKIALIGYGKMGKKIEQIALHKGHSISFKFDIDCPLSKDIPPDQVDVFIDFTIPNAVVGNLKTIAHLQKPVVIGTTGWDKNLVDVKKVVEENDLGLIHAPNFSVGINLFFKIIEFSAELFNHFDDYDVFIHELHHRQKLDSPSGTALQLGNIVIDKIRRKSDILRLVSAGKIEPEQLHISSTRVGSVPGTHTIGYDSEADILELKHTARNRSGFASGAVLAAEWIIDKKGIFTLDDLINNMLLK